MTKPPTDNLGQRQYNLNIKVNDAVVKNVHFSKVKDDAENTELDKFFKIDLAAKCENVDYIIVVLKAGETLYAYRALKKCQWLYDDKHSNIINPEYLNDFIFPVTSMKVKRLILKTVAMRVRAEGRAAIFYEYCMKINMADIAFKCLLFTSEQFKLDLMQNHNEPPFDKIISKKHDYIRFIIGKSFTLLKAYMKMLKMNHDQKIRKFRYLYPVNNIEYLELLEQYVDTERWGCPEFDLKLCEDIMKKYKERVLLKPLFYLKTINPNILIRNSTTDDAKIYAAVLLPSSADDFWHSFYYQSEKKYFDLIPQSEIYRFIKKIFNDKYPGEEFEMRPDFYHQNYFQFMTIEEREEWALNHINSEKQILGVGNDYIWYRFVKFENAFEEIKKIVIVTKEADKRNKIIEILIESARSSRDLERLFNHYHKRHVNELRSYKVSFLNKVITHHNVFDFDESCWAAFFTLLLSMEIYNTLDYKDCNDDYKTVALFYYILNNKALSDELTVYLLDEFFPISLTIPKHLEKLTEQKRLFLYNYLYDFYINKVSESKNRPHTVESLRKMDRFYEVVLKLMNLFNEHHEPVKNIERRQKQRKSRRVNTKLSDRTLLRVLKKDKNLVISKLALIEKRIIENNPVQIRNFLRKIKIYFQNDVSKDLCDMFKDLVTKDIDNASVKACVHGIFVLGNENTKVNFMNSYAPEITKIDYNTIDTPQLRIQKAICQFAPKSLPPVPLSNMLKYLQGDYAQHCLHIFSIYIAALPIPVCAMFVESLLNTPVSIQKHALRLAFQCFDAEVLKNITKSIWEKTKNVSLRSVIYTAAFNRVVLKTEHVLYDALISFSLDLIEDDDKGIFDIVISDKLPDYFLGDYIEACWKAIKTFKDKEPNIQRKVSVINSIQRNSHLVNEEFIESVIDEHLHTMFVENKLYLVYSEEDIGKLYIEKWALIAECVFLLADSKENTNKAVNIAQNIARSCLQMWNETSSDKLIYQQSLWDFIHKLNDISLHYYTTSQNLVPIFEGILEMVVESLQLYEMYMMKWELQITIINRRVMNKYKESFEKDNIAELSEASAFEFGSELGKLVSEYVAKKEYFVSSAEKVGDVIRKSLNELLETCLYSVGGNENDYLQGALISLALGFVEIEMPETYLIALQLLPTQYEECYRDKFQLIVDKIQNYSHLEVQHAVRQKLHKKT